MGVVFQSNKATTAAQRTGKRKVATLIEGQSTGGGTVHRSTRIKQAERARLFKR